ncbi:MAG: glycosyltransferase family 4 protein [Propionicimonas sp.]
MIEVPTPKVTFLGQFFPPEPGAPETSFGIADAIRDAGFDVRVLTGIPNYPAGRAAPGYRAWRRYREQVRGLRTLRVPLYPYHGPAAAKRILNYVSFGLSAATLGGRLLHGSDVNFVISSPATNDMAAYVHRLTGGPPYVLYIQDLWPDSIFATGYLPFADRSVAQRLMQRAVDTAYRKASRILVTSDGMKNELLMRGISPDRIDIVYNWADEDAFRQDGPRAELRTQLGLAPDDRIFLYSGNLGAAQGLECWVTAFTSGAVPDSAHLVLQGRGSEAAMLGELAGAHRQVHFLPPTPDREIAISNMRGADLLVVSLRDHPLFSMTIPSKLTGALAMGRPVAATVPGDAADLISAADAGVVAHPGSVDSVAQVVTVATHHSREALESRGKAGQLYYRTFMSRRSAQLQLTSAIVAASRDGAPK